MDSRAALFFSQLAITCIVLMLCIYKLISSDDCDTRGAFMSLTGLVIGVWLPTPMRIGA